MMILTFFCFCVIVDRNGIYLLANLWSIAYEKSQYFCPTEGCGIRGGVGVAI